MSEEAVSEVKDLLKWCVDNGYYVFASNLGKALEVIGYASQEKQAKESE